MAPSSIATTLLSYNVQLVLLLAVGAVYGQSGSGSGSGLCPDQLVVPCDNCDGLRIPDGADSSGFADLINFTVAIPDGCFVNDVDVFINLTHTWLGDLHMNLKTPLGTDVEFIEDLCGRENDMNGIIIDDEASTQYGNVCPPVSGGRYRSTNGALGTVPSAPSGQWQIVLYDDAAGDTGMIHDFELHLGFSSISASPTQSSAPSASPTADVCQNIRCANDCSNCGLIRHYVEQVWAAVESGETELRFEPATTTRSPIRRARAFGLKSKNSMLSRNTELPNFLRQRRSDGSGSGSGSGSGGEYERNCRDLELRLRYLSTEGMEAHFLQVSGSGSGFVAPTGSGSGIYENRRYDFDHFMEIVLSNDPENYQCGWNSDVGTCVNGGFTTIREAHSGHCKTDAPTMSPTASPTTWISNNPIEIQFFSPTPFADFTDEEHDEFIDKVKNATAESLGVDADNINVTVIDPNVSPITVVISFNNGHPVSETQANNFKFTPLAVTVNGKPFLTGAAINVPDDEDDSLSSGAIVGIVIAVLVGVGIVAFIVMQVATGGSAATIPAETGDTAI